MEGSSIKDIMHWDGDWRISGLYHDNMAAFLANLDVT